MLAVFLGVSAACLTGLLTQDLDQSRRTGAALLGILFLAPAGLVVRGAWRFWPAGGTVVPIRLDDIGPSILKGKLRHPVWYQVPWSSIGEVTYAMIDPPAGTNDRLRELRVLSFVPRPDVDIPSGPPGIFDHLLELPARESVLTFVVVKTWDADIRAMLAWLTESRPYLVVLDSVG
jgi:hypothetical protein